jgi:ATP:ADP antiporter, AAA family
MAIRIAPFPDVREGEWALATQAFLALSFIIAGHTMLETARDALFLSRLPPSQLNLSYMAIAGLSLVVVAASSWFTQRFGRRNALVCSLVLVAYGIVLFHHFTPTPRVVACFYVFSGLVGAVLAPQFWTLAAQLFTVAQGRRLFGPIASGGVIGGMAGAGGAAAALAVVPVTALLPIAAAVFVATALVLTTMPTDEGFALARGPAAKRPPAASALGVLRQNVFLVRLAALVMISTAAVLAVDYLFKSTAARAIAPAHLGSFFARYYAVLNGVSFLVQILVAGRVVRRFGVNGAVGMMPLLLFGTGLATLATGGALLVVLLTKGVDGSLRHSIHRVATELLYLPVPPDARTRAKAFIDVVLGRTAQAMMAAVLYALAVTGRATPRTLASIVVFLCAGWLVVALTMRRSYLDLFRRALAQGGLAAEPPSLVDELDLPSAEVVVETLASPIPEEVVAAMNLLVRKRRGKFIPALLLHHESEMVLVRALEIFRESERRDWIPLAERLIAHPREAVRIAAVRALAKAGVASALTKAVDDTSSVVQAYAAFHLALRDSHEDLLEHPLIPVILELPGEFGDSSRLGLLDAISDTPDPRSIRVILRFARGEFHNKVSLQSSPRMMRALTRAMSKIADPRFIPLAIERLTLRDGRDMTTDLLVAWGEPALDALVAALRDSGTPGRLRAQLPRTIGRFGTQRACSVLTGALVVEKDGLVRYRVLRALERLVTGHPVKVDRPLIEKEGAKNLVEHLRILALRVALAPAADARRVGAPSALLLDELLGDKIAQATDRAFRLLKIAHKREDIHAVKQAARSKNRAQRADAAEFIDALLSHRNQQGLRELFRVVVDDLDPAARVARAERWLPRTPRTHEEALAVLVRDDDDAVAVLAAYHAMTLGDPTLRETVARARDERPALGALGAHFFGAPSSVAEAHGG